MSTRSCVGRYTEGKNWEGVYVHWDGYPNHMGIQLQLIVARDGHELAGKTIIENGDWSSIDAFQTNEETDETHGYGRSFKIVEGYGRAYDEGQKSFLLGLHSGDELANSWCEYLYLITKENKVECYEVSVSFDLNAERAINLLEVKNSSDVDPKLFV